jgi:integrase
MEPYYKLKKVGGNSYVVLIYNYKSQRVELSPSIKCLNKDFGDGKSSNPIKKTDLDYLQKNEILRLYKEDVKKEIFSLIFNKLDPDVSSVRNAIKRIKGDTIRRSKLNYFKDNYSVLYGLDSYLKEITGLNSQSSYPKFLKYRVGVLVDFFNTTYGNSCDLRDLNEDVYRKFQSYLVEVKKYANATIEKFVKQMKQFFNWVKRKGYNLNFEIDFKLSLNTKYNTPLFIDSEIVKEMVLFKEFDFETFQTTSDGRPIYLKHYKGFKNKSYLIKEELRRTIKVSVNVKSDNKKGKVRMGDESTGAFRYYTLYEVIKDMFLFSVSTGLRWSDVVRIKVDDFDFETNKFKLFQKKTSGQVKIVENSLSKMIFQKYSKGKSYLQFLFPLNCLNNEKSRDNYNTKVNKHLKEICSILKLNKLVEVVRMSGKVVVTEKVPLHSVLSFHVARKSHATIVSQMGVDPFSISSQMGHSSLNMTKRYVGQDEKGLKDVFNFIDNEDKGLAETKVDVVVQNSEDNSLESKLDRLKSMRDKGVLPNDVYLQHVDNLLKEFGL